MGETFDTETPRVFEVELTFVGFTTLIVVRSNVNVGANVLDDTGVGVSRLSAHSTLHSVSNHIFYYLLIINRIHS